MIRTAAALLLVALLTTGPASPQGAAGCTERTGVGRLAYVKGGALRILELPACTERVLLRRRAGSPVRWSADGRFIAVGARVVSAATGRSYPLHGVWSPRGHTLATITEGGGLVLRGPDLRDRRLLPDGFGAQSVAFAPTGNRLAVGRAHPRGVRPPARREVWVVDARTRGRRLVYRARPGDPLTPVVRTWTHGGFVLFSRALWPASSVNLDGLPLVAVPAGGGRPRQIVDATLGYDDFLAPCARGLAITAGVDRVTTRGKRLVLLGPPRWRARDLSRDPGRSWVAPACTKSGRWVAASAGRNWVQTRFGLERRSVWLLSADGRTRRRLTAPPPGRSDELPRWTSDARAILFVRSGPTRGDAVARGLLYLVRLDGRLAGPVVDLGTTGNYYGYYGWADQTDLFVPRAAQSASR